VTVVHELNYAAKIGFCDLLLQNLHNGNVDPQLLFMIDEVCFTLVAVSVHKQ
jgi:hypothetical protein